MTHSLQKQKKNIENCHCAVHVSQYSAAWCSEIMIRLDFLVYFLTLRYDVHPIFWGGKIVVHFFGKDFEKGKNSVMGQEGGKDNLCELGTVSLETVVIARCLATLDMTTDYQPTNLPTNHPPLSPPNSPISC